MNPSRLAECVSALRRALLDAEGWAPKVLRQNVFAYAQGTGPKDAVPEFLRRYVETVRDHAYRVTDEDVQALKAEGLSDDEIFEVTLGAAFGAAMARLEKGLGLLEAKR